MRVCPSLLLGLLALASQTLACSAGGPLPAGSDEGGTREMSIVNGREDMEHVAVGEVIAWPRRCSATLIGWHAVLTAAHCVQGSTTQIFQLGYKQYEAAESTYHPSYVNWEKSWDKYVDVAVVKLKEVPPEIPRAVLSTSAPKVGQNITIVGYGSTSTNGPGAGVRRVATNTIDVVKGNHIEYGGTSGSEGTSCRGDSGGPSYSMIDGQEVLIGVHSSGSNECGIMHSDVRVDAHLDWIREQLGSDGDPDETPPEVAIISPANSNASVPSSFVVNVKTSDALSGMAQLDLYVDNELRESVAGHSAEGDKIIFGVKDLAPGEHTVRVEAKDAAGNVSSATSAVTVADTFGPELTIVEPADGASVGTSFTVQLEAKDAHSALGQVQVYVDGKSYQGAAENPLMIAVAGLSGGEHEIWAAAQDSAGNLSYARAAVTVDGPASSVEEGSVIEQSGAERCSAGNGAGTSCMASADVLLGGCTMGGAPGNPSWLWVLLALLFLRRPRVLGRR